MANPIMGALLANALVTQAPMSEDELQVAIAHYRALAALLQLSGPKFSNPRRDAVDMHNRAVRRLRGERDAAEARRLATMQTEEALIELVA